MELEDRLTVPSAEGIDLDLVLAGIGSRAAALLVDLLLQTAVLALVGLGAAFFGDGGLAVLAVTGFAVLLGYPIVAEAFAGGQTVGKALLGIAVVDLDGHPARFLPVVIRNVVRTVDALPGTYGVGLVAVLRTPRAQRLGDLAAGTLVIRRPKRAVAAVGSAWSEAVAAPTSTPGAGARPGVSDGSAGTDGTDRDRWDVSAVGADELAAIAAFLVRRQQLAPEHRARIAAALADQVRPKVAGVPDGDGPEAFLARIAEARTGR